MQRKNPLGKALKGNITRKDNRSMHMNFSRKKSAREKERKRRGKKRKKKQYRKRKQKAKEGGFSLIFHAWSSLKMNP